MVYVDIWGSFCTPCIKEFSYCQEMKDRFKKQPIEYLYLASDYGRFDDVFRWKKIVKGKKLSGYHMLISKEIYEDVWNTIEDSV